MTDAWRSIRLNAFEHVLTRPSQSLLRVSGEDPLHRAPGVRPTLVIETPAGEARFEPLRAPTDLSGVLRAAYAVPTTVIAAGCSCWLQLGDDERIALPAPQPGVGRMRDEGVGLQEPLSEPISSSTADASAGAAELDRAREENQELRLRVAELERELAGRPVAADSDQRALADARAGQASLERQLDQAGDQLRRMTAERDELSRQARAFDDVAVKARERAAIAEASHKKSSSTLRELEVWRGELERRLAQTTAELGAAGAARDADERELARLHAALTEFERQVQPPRSANGADSGHEQSDTVAAQAAEIERLAAELAGLRSRAAREN